MLREALPLFATPVCIFDLKISDSYQKKLQKILVNLDYRLIRNGKGCISDELYLFNFKEFKILNDTILDCFHYFHENVMQYQKNKLKITTSWATKCEQRQESVRHKHTNNLYSAVYYNQCPKGHSNITFYNNNYAPTGYELECEDYNFYNSGNYSVIPRDKSLVVFPANLYHKIQPNLTDKTRYSIACNAQPTPPYGIGDSIIVD
tara:strand:- start:279 stop:893 length:615 start_codon:yes stop_codon:yes gene_type:complete